MTHRTTTQDEWLRRSFKYLNKIMIAYWRAGGGQLLQFFPESVGQIMVLVHTGRKSGLTRYTPLNYAITNGEIYCLAGFGSKAHWHKNVTANPAVEIWLPEGWWAGIAEDASDDPDVLVKYRQVLIASGFAAGTFEGIDPATISDDELADLTQSYRLIRIHRTEARTGTGGPGEYAWVWQIATFVLLFWLLRRRR